MIYIWKKVCTNTIIFISQNTFFSFVCLFCNFVVFFQLRLNSHCMNELQQYNLYSASVIYNTCCATTQDCACTNKCAHILKCKGTNSGTF